MSTPIPSPSMKGTIGLSGAGCPRATFAPPLGTWMRVVVLISNGKATVSRNGGRAEDRGEPAGGIRPALQALPRHDRAGEETVRRRRLGRRAAPGQGAHPLLR